MKLGRAARASGCAGADGARIIGVSAAMEVTAATHQRLREKPDTYSGPIAPTIRDARILVGMVPKRTATPSHA